MIIWDKASRERASERPRDEPCTDAAWFKSFRSGHEQTCDWHNGHWTCAANRAAGALLPHRGGVEQSLDQRGFGGGAPHRGVAQDRAGLALAVCGAGMGATMVLAPSLRQAIVPARLIGRVASTSRMLGMCAAPVGAFAGGWLATTCGIRTPLFAAAGLLLAMTAITAGMTGNRRVEAALRNAAGHDLADRGA